MQLIYAFVFAFAKSRFPLDAASLMRIHYAKLYNMAQLCNNIDAYIALKKLISISISLFLAAKSRVYAFLTLTVKG